MRKPLLVAFLAAMVCGFALAGSTHFCTVQATTDVSDIPKPSVPEFTVELVDSSYDVPTTYSIDPYTGENVTHGGYHVENKSIEVRIKNQPFTPMLVQEGTSTWTAYLHYNVRFKGHYTEYWINAYKPSTDYPKQSDSTYTVLTYAPRDENIYVLGGITTIFPPGVQIDFQVQALIGGVHRVFISNLTNPTGPWDLSPWFFTGEESRWSNTQTITISESQTPTSSPVITPTPTPDHEPQQTEQEMIIGLAIAVAVIGAGLGLLIYFVKRK